MHRLETDASEPRLHLTQARIAKRWSQQEVADKLGTTHVNVSRWERGLTRPGPYFRTRLCKLFGMTEEELDLGSPGIQRPAAAKRSPLILATAEPNVVENALSPQRSTLNSAQTSSIAGEQDKIEHGSIGHDKIGPLLDPAIPLQPVMRLVGREQELAQLAQRLCRGGNIALTALNGIPGVGKTALAVALAHDPEVRRYFTDGVLWAALGPNPNAHSVLSRWAVLLGISASELAGLTDEQALAQALHMRIAGRVFLLVIDDAWQVEHALTFKLGGPNCAHLVTTRFPAIAAQFANEQATALQELDEEESITLLRLLASSVVESEYQRVRDLIRAVGGLPLALTLLGNYLRIQAYTGQPRRITAALQRLSDAEQRLQITEPRGPIESHPSLEGDTPVSLQSVLAVSDQQLTQHERIALYALSVFPPKPNSFSEEAALAVANCTLATLDAIADTGLLESSSPGRYTLHQVIADYAHLRLQSVGAEDGLSGERNLAHQRLITYVTAYIEAHKKDYELLDLEQTTILATLELAHTHRKHAEFIRAATALAPFFLARAMYDEAKQHMQCAYEAAVALSDSYGITNALYYLGEIAHKQGSLTQAETYLREGLALAHRIKDVERISALLMLLGGVTWKRGKSTQAEGYLQEGLAFARQIGDRERICSLLKILGLVVADQGDYSQAEGYLQEGLNIARELGDQEQICVLLMNMGMTVGDRGNYAQAEIYFEEGLVLARLIGHREWISALLGNLGEAAVLRRNYAQAELHFQEGLILARQSGHREWTSILLINLGLTARKQGNYVQAELYLQESLTLARQIGRPQITSNVLNEYGNLYLCQQKMEAAETSFHEMVNAIPEGSRELMALAQYGLARVAAAQGKFQDARKLGEKSVTTLEKIGHRKAQEVRHWMNSITI
ncbi:MAG: tetratricopeptide repeat protein [Ktedonobacteraceae bacterium]|nr:tetratricopeptide repeat protein [Ktedonobacteraceae bacterium]